MIAQLWYRFLSHLGEWPCKRNMESVKIFDNIQGKGLDIGHNGDYSFKNDNVTKLNIYPGENIDIVADGESLPFEDGRFDKILLRCVLEHVKDPVKILMEASRVLNRKGKMVIEVPFINPLHGAPEDFFRFTPNGLIKLVQDQELVVDKIFYTEDINYAIKWLVWQRFKENGDLGIKILIKMITLKYLINPLFLRSSIPNENNFSQFGFVVMKDSI